MLTISKPNATPSPVLSDSTPTAEKPKLLDQMRATHVLNRGGMGVFSPLDRIPPSISAAR